MRSDLKNKGLFNYHVIRHFTWGTVQVNCHQTFYTMDCSGKWDKTFYTGDCSGIMSSDLLNEVLFRYYEIKTFTWRTVQVPCNQTFYMKECSGIMSSDLWHNGLFRYHEIKPFTSQFTLTLELFIITSVFYQSYSEPNSSKGQEWRPLWSGPTKSWRLFLSSWSSLLEPVVSGYPF